jgi:hypothetical protein
MVMISASSGCAPSRGFGVLPPVGEGVERWRGSSEEGERVAAAGVDEGAGGSGEGSGAGDGVEGAGADLAGCFIGGFREGGLGDAAVDQGDVLGDGPELAGGGEAVAGVGVADVEDELADEFLLGELRGPDREGEAVEPEERVEDLFRGGGG